MYCTFKLFRSVIIGMYLSLPIISTAQVEKKLNPIIVIDPGHGGKDSGAIGINGLKEKDVVLQLAMAIIEWNNKIKNGKVQIYSTRYSDTLISLGDRVKLTKALKADLFISFHCNKAQNSNARGIEIYVYDKKRIYSRESILIGFEMEKALSSKISLKSRGIKFADFQVLRDGANEFPAILMEMGFLSNLDESYYLLYSKNLKFLAYIIYQTIIKNVKE